MAISLNGTTIEINSGIDSGTATSATATTLTDSGGGLASYTGRIVWITGGAGAGQSRFVLSATATQLTVQPSWDVQPDATSTYTIAYNYVDVVTAVPSRAAYIGASVSKSYELNGNLSILAGGALGETLATVVFSNGTPVLTQAKGSLWQHGRLLGNGKGVDGGSIQIAHGNSAFVSPDVRGFLRMYGAKFLVRQTFSETVNAQYRIGRNNTDANSDGYDFVDSYLNNLYVVAGASSDGFLRNNFENAPFWPQAPLSRFDGNSLIENSFVIAALNAGARGADYFNLSFDGQAPPDAIFNRPIFANLDFNSPVGSVYLWNMVVDTAIYPSETGIIRWHSNAANGTIYRGVTLNLNVEDTLGNKQQDAVVGLIRSGGSGAWMTGRNGSGGNYAPILSSTVVTDANGEVANPLVAGQGLFVILREYRRSSLLVTNVTSHTGLSFRVRKYGFNYQSSSRTYALESEAAENVFLINNAQITESNSATVAAYIDAETTAKAYDYSQYDLSLAANIAVDEYLSITGSTLDAGSHDVVIDPLLAGNPVQFNGTDTVSIRASTFVGDMITTGVITLANGAQFNGTRTDANGTIAPPAFFTVSVSETGADVVILAAGTNTVLASVDAQAGNDFAWQYAGAQNVDVGVIKPGFRVTYIYNFALTGASATLPVTLLQDRSYI